MKRSSGLVDPSRFSPSLHYLLLNDTGETKCYEEDLQVEPNEKWEQTTEDEMDSLLTNQTWDLVLLPDDKKALHNKWVYRLKEEHDGTKRYKARLVVRGFE